jgi:hypothetical protein
MIASGGGGVGGNRKGIDASNSGDGSQISIHSLYIFQELTFTGCTVAT